MEKYRFSEEAFRLMEDSAIPFAVYQFINKRVVTLVVSAGFCRLLGYEDKAQAYWDMDNDMYKDTHPDDVARISEAAFRFATEGGRYETIYRSRSKDGGYRILHAQGEHVYTGDGVRLAQVWYTDEGPYLEDTPGHMPELNQTLTMALHRESVLVGGYYDHLTGLPTMLYFFDLAEAGSKAVREEGGIPVLLYLDLNGLNLYSRTYGYAEGDKLLQSFARLLVRHFSTENCCRSGEDHFAVYTRREGIEEILDRLFKDWQELSHLPVRVGIYEGQDDAVDVGAACDRAKFACESLKDALISGICWYDEQMRLQAAEYRYIANHLDEALEKGWIQAYYQPIIRAATGMVCSEEALARWINPEAGTLNPDTFIPPLEEAGLIYKLDLRVVELVLEKIRTFSAAGHNVVPQSVNLSRVDFDACDMVEEIRRRVDEAGVSRKMLVIEITESVIGRDVAFMKTQVDRFRALGFPVWMDDFGSGYSSLDVLQGIEFDLIKFDMQFMHESHQGSRGKIVLTELMKLVSALGLDAVCEGVETAEQASFLREIGCSKLQGYFFSQPLSQAEIMAIADGPNRARLEDPRESGYYEDLGRINLFDLGTLAYEGAKPLRNVFNSLPMAILEVRDSEYCFIRTNQSYRDFMRSSFGIIIDEEVKDTSKAPSGRDGPGGVFRDTVQQCCRTRGLAVFDGKLAGGYTAHYFLRYIGTNPLSGASAVIVAVLSIKDEG
jgi:EAL domain-containing protein (putative c-di-GMP-specific phosphodiesterase class I)